MRDCDGQPSEVERPLHSSEVRDVDRPWFLRRETKDRQDALSDFPDAHARMTLSESRRAFRYERRPVAFSKPCGERTSSRVVQAGYDGNVVQSCVAKGESHSNLVD